MFSNSVTKALSQFVFKLLMPVMLFHLMSDASDRPPVDWKVLIAFFGSCVVVYIIGNILGGKLFKQDSTGRVITGMGGIFGNNVQLGVPIVQTSLGTAAMPTISLLIIFNVLLLWTSATACVEFGRTGGNIDWKKFLIALKNICWIEVGCPDIKTIRKAAGRSEDVVVLAYDEARIEPWWQSRKGDMSKVDKLSVRWITDADLEKLAAMHGRNMKIAATVQDGIVWLADDAHNIEIEVKTLMRRGEPVF